ncbi:hypothetical protein [Microbacterium sp. CGR1]|uniref:hypothetical protein n=1 Tax=Microbacterium sp. CGR1 TaxID=1696072 RepID=UPI003DA47C77
MTDEQQPDVRWAPMEPQPSNRGRIALIVGLIVAGLVVVGALLFFLLPRGESPIPGASETPSASPSPYESMPGDPTDPPVTTAPEPVDPSIETFRDQVGFWLEDAARGLDIAAANSGPDAVQVVETLQEDAQRLSDTLPPSSIATEWSDGVADYAQKLADLKTAASEGSDTASAADAARTSLQVLTELVGA